MAQPIQELPGHGEYTLAAGWAHGDISVPGSLRGPTLYALSGSEGGD